MLAKLISRNQLTLPKAVTAEVEVTDAWSRSPR